MKKTFILFLCVYLFLLLSACTVNGKTKNVKITECKSQIYSDEDIASAINETVDYFKKEFKGCTLTEIGYAGDESVKEFVEWSKRYEADEAIILISSFDVDSSGGDGSLDPNSTYRNWKWILIRNSNGAWKHVDHGYG